MQENDGFQVFGIVRIHEPYGSLFFHVRSVLPVLLQVDSLMKVPVLIIAFHHQGIRFHFLEVHRNIFRIGRKNQRSKVLMPDHESVTRDIMNTLECLDPETTALEGHLSFTRMEDLNSAFCKVLFVRGMVSMAMALHRSDNFGNVKIERDSEMDTSGTGQSDADNDENFEDEEI